MTWPGEIGGVQERRGGEPRLWEPVFLRKTEVSMFLGTEELGEDGGWAFSCASAGKAASHAVPASVYPSTPHGDLGVGPLAQGVAERACLRFWGVCWLCRD